ncbi:Metallo-dependent phosphatase-like protein [Russula earlei]|uniref:Metallo-dependent phosphatase-like protein n=1 Tax=Russula earlei TaxID=71964 RepID=A0ACC0UK05_9AGAM|nr:Metallo-dependent phosphatase-like protein [Russula earlei]
MAPILRPPIRVCVLVALSQAIVTLSLSYGPSSYAPPGAFPTSLYDSYYNDPTATSAQPQPVISDPVLHKVFVPELTDPRTIPQNDTRDLHLLPSPASGKSLLQVAKAQFGWMAANGLLSSDKCKGCVLILQLAQFISQAAPEQGPPLLEFICQEMKLSDKCAAQFGPTSFGSVLTQVFAKADVQGYDGQLICNGFFAGSCPLPPTPPLNLTGWFAKPKPNPLPAPKMPSGERLKVLHLSDFHLDPRYATGSEANCSAAQCCRDNTFNANSPNQTLFPAPRYGSYLCDTPFSLAAAALEAIPPLTGTEQTGFAWTIFTGDLVSHDPENQQSRDYVMYEERVVYDLFKRTLGPGPVYVALGNHDTYDQHQAAPHSLGGAEAEQFSWSVFLVCLSFKGIGDIPCRNYDHVAGLWKLEDWLPGSAVLQARSHYAAYSVQRRDGLRLISLNSDFCTPNLFNYINLSIPDKSGMLRFLTDQLQDAEDVGDRVWIIGHVPTGWDATDALEVPSNLCGVDRFSPHVIANIFFGHTHEDMFSIYYTNNGTNQTAQTAITTSWIGPSVTPFTNLNSGFRVYEVDSATFDIVDAHTWRSDVNSYPGLDGQTEFGPSYVYEYSTRAAYGKNITWDANAPLNATWWHLVTERTSFLPPPAFTNFQTKQSVHTRPCTGSCITAKICYMRSGSSSISIQNCAPGFGTAGG